VISARLARGLRNGHGEELELLGHSSITVTLDTYSHVTPGIHKAAALAIGSLIFGVDAPPPPRAPKRRATAAHPAQQLSLDESD
jgi:hypothetical protein